MTRRTLTLRQTITRRLVTNLTSFALFVGAFAAVSSLGDLRVTL